MHKRTLTFTEKPAALQADFYRPDDSGTVPVVIAIHGGAWKKSTRGTYALLGPYLAERGIAVLSIDYRLVDEGANRYPAAVDDARTALGYVRDHAAELGVDGERIALMGDSAGAQLAALIALGDEPSPRIKVVVGIYGIYDMAAQWMHDRTTREDNITEDFLGVALPDNRELYFSTSPLSYAVKAKNATAMLIVWGSDDDIVDPSQSAEFVNALKIAGFNVRTVIARASHYWIRDPMDEPESPSLYAAARIARFLKQTL